MICSDCGAPMAPSLMPLCAPCTRIAVRLLGSVDARLAILETT